MLAPSAAALGSRHRLQGHDIYSRTVYGARASVTVGLGQRWPFVGRGVRRIGRFYGGWIDAVARGSPMCFSACRCCWVAIVLMQKSAHHRTVWTVIAILACSPGCKWPGSRAAVLEVKAAITSLQLRH